MNFAENRSDVDLVKRMLADPSAVLPRLGFKPRREGSGWKILCPWHDERTPSCSVQTRDGVLLAKCHGCGEGGDVLSLVAAVERLSLPRDFAEALRVAADVAGIALGDGREPSAYVPRAPVESPPRPFPPSGDVLAIWEIAVPVNADPDTSSWLRSRGLDPDRIEKQMVARALPRVAPLPAWATYRGGGDAAVPWTETGHRLLVAMRDAAGELKSVRARAIVATNDPKTLPPSGFRCSGLVMADPVATMMLATGSWPAFADGRLVVVEGEPDFLCWVGRGNGQRLTAVIGVTSGAWTPELAAKVPSGTRVIVRTDTDEAGDKYASAITSSLISRCSILRKAAA